MSELETRLRDALADPSWALPVPPDPAAWAKQRAHRGRWRPLAAALAAALVAGAGAVTVPGLLQPAQPQPSELEWTQLPDAPVSPRRGAVAAWTGREALFLGGETGDPPPPGASSERPPERARDGAAYDLATQTWRATAPAPVDLIAYTAPAVIGDVVHLMIDGRLLTYDASDDRWSTLPTPPGPPDAFWRLEAPDGQLVALRDSEPEPWFADQLYDRATGQWTALPRDPIAPTVGRRLTATPAGWLLTGFPPSVQGSPGLHAALLDRQSNTWRALPDAEGGGHLRTWTGERFVSVDTNLAGDESERPGVTYPRGVALDVKAGAWSPLRNAPEEFRQGWTIEAVAGERIATGGYLYDDEDARWTLINRPDEAPPQGASAVWAGQHLIAMGGFDPSGGYTAASLSNQAFSYRPAGGAGPPGRAGCSAGQRCPAPATPDVRFVVEVDGRAVAAGAQPVDIAAGTSVDLTLRVTAPTGTRLRSLTVGDADDSWGQGPDGPTGLDQVLIDAPDVDSATFERTLTWTPQGNRGDVRNLVAIFTMVDEGGSVGTRIASVRLT